MADGQGTARILSFRTFKCFWIDLLKPTTLAKSKYAGKPAKTVIPVVFFSVSYLKGSAPYAIILSPHCTDKEHFLDLVPNLPIGKKSPKTAPSLPPLPIWPDL